MKINTTLYKKTATGAVQQWEAAVIDNKITVTFGQVDGKLQTKDTFCEGKNIGRSNATSPEDQAVKEAVAKWEKQKKSGYVECPSGTRTVLLPMKVKAYFDAKNKDKVKFPASIGRKLNGVNGECRIVDGNFVQLSRGGEEYPPPPQKAQQDLIKAMSTLGVNSLNYEIYLHGEHLQDITGAVKAPHNHKELWEKLEYHVFDIPSSTDTWEVRAELLKKLVPTDYVKSVENYTVNSHEEIIEYQDSFVANGYEGSVVRNYKGLYEYNKRSSDVLKVKYVESEEFKVTSWTLDKNNHPIYVCSSKGGDFKVKRKGTDEERKADAKVADNNIGKWLTVDFETMSKAGKPLKPIGICFRKGYENEKGVFVPTE